MQFTDIAVFEQTTSGYGTWFDVSSFSAWSLHVIGLEAGGSFILWGSNEPFEPTASVQDASAAQTGTITGTGANLMYQGVGTMHWVQLQKTAGGTPTATTVYLFGQLAFG